MERTGFVAGIGPCFKLASGHRSRVCVAPGKRQRRRVARAAADQSATAEEAGTLDVRKYGAPGVISFRPLESNSWVLEVGTKRVFVDPWLIDTLVFGNAKVFEAKKAMISSSTSVQDYGPIDLVVLSQHLADHCHVPTLSKLDKSIPILCGPEAEEILRGLGYRNIRVLTHGTSAKYFDESLEIAAFPGSLVGPPWSERMNAYTFSCQLGAQDASNRSSYKLFYEPHADVPDSTLAQVGTVDGVLTPSVQVTMLPGSLNYPLVRGGDTAVGIVEKLKARDAIVLRNNDTVGSGFIESIVAEQNSHEQFESELKRRTEGQVEVIYQEFGEAKVLAQPC